MSKENDKTVTIQIYLIHLLNGDIVQYREEFDVPYAKGIISKFKSMKDSEYLEFGHGLKGMFCIPVKNVLFISTGDVVEVNKWR